MPKKYRRPVRHHWYSRRRRRSGMTIPVAPILGMLPMFVRPIQFAIAGDLNTALKTLSYDSIGYNMDSMAWESNTFIRNITPLAIGLLVHKFVGGKPFNMNATLAKAKIPYLRI